jgi:large subunit ribosomal protein L13
MKMTPESRQLILGGRGYNYLPHPCPAGAVKISEKCVSWLSKTVDIGVISRYKLIFDEFGESSMKTFVAKEAAVEKKWHLVDARGQIVGRLATQIAMCLRGKTKPIFTPHADAGDFVIVVNAAEARFTGKKLDDKVYYRHTGYIGGIKAVTARQLFKTKPEEVLRNAVRGMLPKNSLGRRLLKKLKIYAGGEHPHQAQMPQPLALTTQSES